MSNRDLVRALATLAACWLGAGSVHGAEQVVLESNTRAYPAGRTLDATAEIALAADEFVVFATEDGRLLRIAGPYEGLARGAAADRRADDDRTLRRILAQLFGLESEEAGALAGVRGPAFDDAADAGADTRTDPWVLHAERTGDQCIIGERPARFWRETAVEPSSAEVLEVAGGRSAVLDWPAQASIAEWRSAAPADGEVYLVRPEGELRSVAIRVHALPAALEPRGLVAVAWLATRGCIDQARLLLRQVDAGNG